MAAIRNSTAACSRSFRLFAAALESGDAAHRSLVDLANLEDEYGRFRVWTGNLGAQQKGHSSLDYRLRDSPLLQSNALKLLHELELNLNEARAIVTGARLPYEQQAVREDFSDDSTSEDSEDSTDSEEERPKYELQQRMAEVIDIVNNLYRLSIRIRSPTVRTRALKAAVYRQVDPETGVDVFSQYAEYDKKHTEEVLAHLRAGRKDDDVAFLVERLSRAITRRRQQFKYWKKHREKLSSFAETADTTSGPVNDRQASQSQAAMNATGNIARTSEPLKIDLRAPASEDQPRTLLSGTEATAHHRTLDDAVDSQSVTSVATTARDLDGHGIDLPPPPDSADGERDFECPYCFVICPARYARVRSWKTHILQDLQSYVCTYKDCSLSDQMFRSRREWLEHESSSHRKVWRCPGHPDAVYSSREGLLCHLESIHNSDLGETQLQQLIRLAGTATNDLRQCCPICLVSAKDPGVAGNLHNHIANHLEKLASFALPKFAGPDEAKSGASMDASDGRRSYSEKSDATSSLWSVNTQSNRENERQDSVRPTTGLDQTADDMISRILELLDAVERSPESVVFSEEDWLKVRPGFCSFFPQPEAPRVIAFLDDFFHQLGESRIDLGTLRSEIRRVLSSAFATPPPDEATNPGPVLSPGSRFPKVEQARLLAWSTYSLCKDLGSHSTSLRDDLFTIHANLSALADASDSSGSLRLDRITQAIKGTTDTLKHIKGVIEQCKPNPTDESTTQELCKKLAVWIWRIDALAANLKSNQGAEGKDLPELSADAINSLPDARTSRMEHFIQTIGQSTPESESQALGPNVMDYESAKTFAIHAIDSSADESQKEPHSPVEESNETCTVRVYNLPKTTEEREGFVNLFSALGPHLQVGPTFESRGFAVFRSREEAEHALSIFDNSKFPDVIFGFDKDGEEHAGGTVPSQSNLPIEFDVEGFLEALSRALSKPENWKHIAWAEDGRTFCVYDEEAVVPHVLPAFGLESFSLFEDRLIACGFRRQYGQQFRTNADGLKRTSVWFHKHFQRDKEEGRRSIPFLTKLQNIFSKTKESPRASLLTSQLDDAGTEIGVVSSRKPRSNFVLMAVSDIPSISDLYLSGWLQAPNAAAASAYLLAPKGSINRKISMLQHDITMLDVDAIVNGTAPGLNAGASDSISYWIHKAAGPNLLRECQSLSNCQMGQAVMTNAYDLPCRKVIHTVRPHYFQAYNSVDHNALLASCYRNCLTIAAAKGLESIAFPCLSAGGFCFPSREAAKIALRTTREFFDSGRGGSLQKIVFCVYSDVDNQVYRAVIPLYFPPTKINSGLQREVREETPGSVDEDCLVDTPDQERQDLFDMELASAGPSKQTKPTRLNESVESLSRLTGGPSLWACCKCRARPMEIPNCLVCYHELCNSCEEERGSMQPPNLFLVYLRPSPDMLEDPQRIGLSSIDNREMNNEDHTRGSVRSRANSPTGKYHPTHVKAHRKHVSLDTLFYYDLPFQFDSFDQDYVIITRELSEEQSEILFEHSRRHRRNLPSLIRTRAHPNPMSDVLTIRIGSDPSFNKQDRPPGAPIYFPGPVVTADHCDFYIAGCRQWMLEINRASGSTFLNGRRLVRLPCPEDNNEEQGTTPALPPHDDRGYFIRSGDILGLGENDHGKPAYLFRIELDCVSGTEQDLWEDAEARASRYGFPTIGLEEDDEASDLEDDDDVVDPEIASGYRIVDAEQTNLAHIPEQARGAPRWTRIDRRLVNPDALKEAGLFFENRVRFMLVFKELSAGEVRRLAQRTRESRAAKAETEFTRKERRRKERRIREQKKVARQRKKGLLEEREGSRLGM